jgi:lactoylglutathione lyase
MPRLVGINHVAVEVDDIDEALAFLGRIFDLTLRGRSARMAFVDMGDQFIALAAADRTQTRNAYRHMVGHRHIGLVVDDRQATLAAAAAAGARLAGDNDFLDPWGNRWQIVDYRDVQFTKAPRILEGMGLADLEKSERTLDELRAKGLSD